MCFKAVSAIEDRNARSKMRVNDDEESMVILPEGASRGHNSVFAAGLVLRRSATWRRIWKRLEGLHFIDSG